MLCLEGRMRLNNENKIAFILHCLRLSLPLSPIYKHDERSLDF